MAGIRSIVDSYQHGHVFFSLAQHSSYCNTHHSPQLRGPGNGKYVAVQSCDMIHAHFAFWVF